MFKNISKLTGKAALMLLMGMTSLSYAQSSSGGIAGTVQDSTGAVVAGATVEIENTKTGLKRSITTKEDGSYNVTSLDPGVYTITVTAAGFSNATANDVQVSVSFVTNANINLQPGSDNIVVDVNASDALTQINLNDQQLSTLIDNKKILQLPLLSRDPNALILLSPGVFPANSGLGGFSVNGSRERNNNFQVDGVDNNDTEVPGIPGGVTTPSIDATQEFRVITSNFNAEYGRNTGAIINVATKSGSNEFHGGAYYYNRDGAAAARNFFDGPEKRDLKRNQFGGTFGGPIIKNKLFFFANYEADIFDIGSRQIRIVPSANARMGILDNTPFGRLDIRPNGTNNPNGFGFSPTILQLLNQIYPLGNDPVNSPFPGTLDAFAFNFTTENRQQDIATRVDYQISDKNRISARYGFTRFEGPLGGPTFPGTEDEGNTLQRSQLAAFTFTSVITPNLVNEFKLGANRVNAPFSGPGSGGNSTKLDDIVRAAFKSNGADTNFLPFGTRNGQVLNLGFGGISGLGGFDTQTRFTGTTTLSDNVSYNRGKHAFKFGIESRFVYSNSDTNFGRSEAITFALPTTFGFPIIVDSRGNDIPTTGVGGTFNNFASTLYGLVDFQTQTQFFNVRGERTDNNQRGFRVRELDFYVQDTWRLFSNFTLNYGVRYEFKGVPFEVNGQLTTLVGQDPGGFTPKGGFIFTPVGNNTANETSTKLYDDDFNNFAPRFGFAWDPFKKGKTSVRGGYGVFYDRVFGNLFTNARGNPPFEILFFNIPALNDLNDAILENIPRTPSIRSTNIVLDGDELAPVIFPVTAKNGASNNPFKKDFRNLYSQNFNFGIQQELLRNLVLEVDYVGAKGTNLLNVVDGNLTSVKRKNTITGANRNISTSLRTNYLNGSLNTAFNIAFLNLASAFSTYHALTVRVTKTLTDTRFGTGQIQGAYTYSHAIDDGNDPLVPSTGGRSLPRDSSGFAGGQAAERGESGNDTRNRFVMNFIYDFPFKSSNKVLNQIVSNFSMSGIFQAQDGNPYSVFYNGLDTQGTGLSARGRFANGRPGITPATGINPRLQTGPSSSLFLPASVSLLDGNQGDVPRGAFVSPGFNQVDFSIIKGFSIKEKNQFSVRADFFNLFNRVNLGIPNTTLGSPLFGVSTTAGASRVIQFVARYNF